MSAANEMNQIDQGGIMANDRKSNQGGKPGGGQGGGKPGGGQGGGQQGGGQGGQKGGGGGGKQGNR